MARVSEFLNRPRFRILSVLLLFFGVAWMVTPVPVNPPVVNEPSWYTPETRELIKMACFDCHSNEAAFPWYAYVPPAAWWVRHQVSKARGKVNFSAWNANNLPETLLEVVETGKMPPSSYILFHLDADLDEQTRARLLDGLSRTLQPPADSVSDLLEPLDQDADLTGSEDETSENRP